MIARRSLALFNSAPLALAAALMATGMASPALAKKKPMAAEAIDAALAKNGSAAMVEQAERAVEDAPRDASLRAVLGRAYLKEGRFASATTALSDAVTLGDGSSRTMLALALAQIGAGQNREAVQTLDSARNVIPAADLGLALALAGEGSRGTTILGDALRAGDKSDKLRANLAYAYALDGRWAEARNLVSLDLPANEVDQRMTEWAKAATPEASRDRVATLLGVSIKADGGLPQRLALAPALDGGVRMAAAEAAPANTPALAAAPEPAAPEPAAPEPVQAELPAVSEPAPLAAEPAAPAPAPVQWAAVAPAEAPAEIAPAVIPAAVPAPVAFHAVTPKGAKATKLAVHQHKAKAAKAQPKATPKTDDAAPLEAPVEVAQRAEPTPAATSGGRASGGHHAVQLGAFLSEKNAQRAKKLAMGRDKSLSGDDVIITKADVGGKTFWRVQVAGLNSASAAGKCASIRKGGGACFAIGGAPVKLKAAPKLALKPAPKTKAIALVATVKGH